MGDLKPEVIAEALESKNWEFCFPSTSIDAARRFVASRLVKGVSAEIFDTGDCEISGTVFSKEGSHWRSSVAIWCEDGVIAWEGDCDCGGGTHCEHAAALLTYLGKGKGERWQRAIGNSVNAMPESPGNTIEVLSDKAMRSESGGSAPTFSLYVDTRPAGDRFSWLPEIFASASAKYEESVVPLDPTGSMIPIGSGEDRIRRDRQSETEALQLLYALDLVPGAEDPPPTLRAVAKPETKGPLWAPESSKWPHPEFYWKRFRHEGVHSLEKRGWSVRFAPGVGHKPLVFRTDSWQAEIVEEGKGWFHLSAGFEIEGETFELQPILATLVENRFLESTEGMPDGQEFLVFLPDGRSLVLPVGRFRRLLTTLGEIVDFSFGEGAIKLSTVDAARLLPVVEGVGDEGGKEGHHVVSVGGTALAELGNQLWQFEKLPRTEVPPGLDASLRSYQETGFSWMQHLVRNHLNGILADDMGLGKTLQTLTHVLAEVESGANRGRPSLVVAPTSVVLNWEREAARFTPDLSVLVLQGPERHDRFRRVSSADVVLTSFALLVRDEEELARHDFHLVVLDEAQYIKNPEALTSRAACRLRSEHRLCLSGTPIENHLGELWSLFHFLQPGLLGSKETFRSVYRTPIEKNDSAEKRRSLVERIGPLVLRRTKYDVAKELPPKTEIVHMIEMEADQKDLYETVRSTMDKRVRQALAARGQEARIVFLDALLKLRQICCHPRLLKRPDEKAGSAKFDRLVELLSTLREEGHRVLLFSQFTSMLETIREYLEAENVSYLLLTGETKDRQELVERFQSGEGEVFLISLKAGGTGLTLTGADTVIHYDPWWNPAAENQATDRAYRIGQDKPVFVHKLICRSTVEEKIQQMQERKDGLADDLLSGAMGTVSFDDETITQLLAPSNSE